MRTERAYGLGRGRGLKVTNARGRPETKPRVAMIAVTVLAVGLIAFTAAVPAAAAGKPDVRDDDKWGNCPKGYELVWLAYGDPAHDRNGNGFVCWLVP